MMIATTFEKELKKIFGEDANIKIVHEDHIECGTNGKFRVTISEI